MSIAAHLVPMGDPFAKSCEHFQGTLTWAGSAAADALDHAQLEEQLLTRLMGLGRQLLQERYDLHAERERLRPPVLDGERRARSCKRETVFGTVTITRMAYTERPPASAVPAAQPDTAGASPPPSKRPGRVATMPLDRALSLPAHRYSLPVEWRVVQFVLDCSYDRTGHHLTGTTAARVPKRQRIEVIQRAARDYADFYTAFERPANDTMSPTTLLVATMDATGVHMRTDGLRDATRALAEAAAAEPDPVQGDPLAPHPARPHTHRMAQLGAVYEQEPMRREAQDIVRELMKRPPASPARSPRTRKTGTTPAVGAPSAPAASRKPPRQELPRPQNKRMLGSLEQDAAIVIRDVFDEVQPRDPTHRQRWVVLVDGQESQMEQVHANVARLAVTVTIVVDLLHALHYLWLLGKAVCRRERYATQVWVRKRLVKLLTQPVNAVLKGIRHSLAAHGVDPADAEEVAKSVTYLEKNAPYLRYAEYLAEGLPIATGVIEGACRHVIKDRMDRAGMRWGLKGAEALLKLRLLAVSGHLGLYWHFHARREHERTYPQEKAA
jgi:hypothetical protein